MSRRWIELLSVTIWIRSVVPLVCSLTAFQTYARSSVPRPFDNHFWIRSLPSPRAPLYSSSSRVVLFRKCFRPPPKITRKCDPVSPSINCSAMSSISSGLQLSILIFKSFSQLRLAALANAPCWMEMMSLTVECLKVWIQYYTTGITCRTGIGDTWRRHNSSPFTSINSPLSNRRRVRWFINTGFTIFPWHLSVDTDRSEIPFYTSQIRC